MSSFCWMYFDRPWIIEKFIIPHTNLCLQSKLFQLISFVLGVDSCFKLCSIKNYMKIETCLAERNSEFFNVKKRFLFNMENKTHLSLVFTQICFVGTVADFKRLSKFLKVNLTFLSTKTVSKKLLCLCSNFAVFKGWWLWNFEK